MPWEDDSVAWQERRWGVREVVISQKYELLVHTCCAMALTQEEENRHIKKKNTVE